MIASVVVHKGFVYHKNVHENEQNEHFGYQWFIPLHSKSCYLKRCIFSCGTIEKFSVFYFLFVRSKNFFIIFFMRSIKSDLINSKLIL